MATNGENRAMVVDDSRAMRMILRKILGDLGYEVYEAGNGQEALQVLDRGVASPSLMLVDWNMPVMCGLELVKAVRSDGRYSATAVIMVTTETEMQHMSQALEAGASEYIMKPFTKETIADKLRAMNLVN